MRHSLVFALLAGALAVQAAPCQVSMRVTTSIGGVGYACEPFRCLPNQSLAGLGEYMTVEMYGMQGMPYVLFLGMPGEYCQPIAGFGGQLGVAFPIFTHEVGVIVDHPQVPACELAMARTQYAIPEYMPLGIQIRMQMFGLDKMGPAFSRAVEVHTR